MADLLECLLQIKALRETLPRLQKRLSQVPSPHPPAADDALATELSQLLASELRWQHYLRATLSHLAFLLLSESPSNGPPAPTEGLRGHTAAFVEARLATLRLLEAASATDLASVGVLPGRGPTSVADVIAVMLAEDTDRLGEVQRVLART